MANNNSVPYDSQQANVTFEGSITLPAETICHIIRYLGPQDLIRLQVVSKLFYAITRDPALWRNLYSTAYLPLPPGPFPWQSTRFFQRTLVRSARLAQTWTTEPLTLISSKIYTGPRSIDDDRFQWICGRWLIVSKDMKQLRSRDVETGCERVLWNHGSFAYWATTSVMIPQGHLIFLVVHLGRGRLADPVKLLEFLVDDDTGNLVGPEMFDVPFWTLPRVSFIPHIRIDSGHAPYVYISLDAANKPRHSLIFDPRYRRFYKFPRFRTQLDLLVNYRGAWLPHLVEVHFTRTHLFVLSRSYLIHGHLGEVEVIQTFVFPDVDPHPGSNSDGLGGGPRSNVRELRLTHETLTRDTRSAWLAPIRNAIVDPITKSTTLRFMHIYAPCYPSPDTRVRIVCTDYILPPSSTGSPPATAAKEGDRDQDDNHDNENENRDRNHNHNHDGLINNDLNAIVRSTEQVLPITIVAHDIFSVQGQWKGNLVDASHDGFVRGLCMVGWRSGGETTPTGKIHKFTVDATGERCVAVVGDPSPPLVDLDTSRNCEYPMDGMRGKIWYTKWDVLERNSAGELVDRDVLAVVVEFK